MSTNPVNSCFSTVCSLGCFKEFAHDSFCGRSRRELWDSRSDPAAVVSTRSHLHKHVVSTLCRGPPTIISFILIATPKLRALLVRSHWNEMCPPLLRLPNWAGSLSTERRLQPWSESRQTVSANAPALRSHPGLVPHAKTVPVSVSVMISTGNSLTPSPASLLSSLSSPRPLAVHRTSFASPMLLLSLAFHPFPSRPNLHKPLIATRSPSRAMVSHDRVLGPLALPSTTLCSCWQASARACR